MTDIYIYIYREEQYVFLGAEYRPGLGPRLAQAKIRFGFIPVIQPY